MEVKNLDANSRKERTVKRKEVLERKKVVDSLIKAACTVKDHLDLFPDFRHYNQRGLRFSLEAGHGAKLSRYLKQYVQKLLKLNMESHYGMEWPTEEKAKYREINAPEARYIFVHKTPTFGSNELEKMTNEHKGDIVGFIHYRFTLEEDLPALYVYELQLEPAIQGRGLGSFLMQLLELIAQKSGMSAIVLTVLKRNLSAMLFYTRKMGYFVAATSPSRVDPLIGAVKSYEILYKAFDQEARSKLEVV